MVVIGQAVEHRDAGILRQRFYSGLTCSSVLDGIVHTSKDAGCVFERLFVTQLRAGRIEVGDVGPLVVTSHFERAAGARGGLLEDQTDFLAFEMSLLGAGILGALE